MARFGVLAVAFLLTGSIACSAQEKTEKTVYNSIIDMLRRQNGVVVGADQGTGTMPTIYIRGIGTNTDQYQPLFVVDGIKTDNIMYIQPEDVYSIEVIKDGTSAIYGMQGANGVIEIKTKSHMEAEKRAAEEKKAAKKAARKARKKGDGAALSDSLKVTLPE